jgi:hypothetical protein
MDDSIRGGQRNGMFQALKKQISCSFVTLQGPEKKTAVTVLEIDTTEKGNNNRKRKDQGTEISNVCKKRTLNLERRESILLWSMMITNDD